MENTDTPSKQHLHYAADLEALFASIGEGLIATNDSGRITRVNQPALNIFGYTAADLLGRRFTDMVIAVYENGKPVDVIDRPIAKALLTGSVVSEKTLYLRKDGSIVHVHVTVSPLLLEGKPIGAVQLFRDISAEIEMDKMKSDFISLASHQLRTPLSAVNIYAGMLLDGLAGPLSTEQAHFGRQIVDSARRMNELIDTLLNITRIEAKGLEVNQGQVNLRDVVQSALPELRTAATARDIKLSVAPGDKSLLVITDPHLAKEALINLGTNAIKYTPAGGRIIIKLAPQGNYIVVSVRDTGYGIPQSAKRHIFTKFFRADNILKHDVRGTGLGLYLTKTIVEGLGGDIWFESEEGKGSVFYFSLPRK